MITLRPYQDGLVSDIRSAYLDGHRSVLAVLPTGGGKTVVFTWMAAEASRRNMRVGICAHRSEILDQIGAALDQFGVQHGYVSPGRSPNPFASVQVCSIQAMASKKRLARYIDNPFDFLIVDEAHHAAGGTQWHKIIEAHRGKRILGVTATPERLSGEPLSVSFDHMIVGPSTAELIALGALSPYRAYAPSRPDLTGVRSQAGDYVKGELDEAMDRPTITGDAVMHYKRIVPGKRAIVFCVSIAHAEHVAEQFEQAGVKAASIDGKMDRVERRGILKRFADGIVPVLTSCEIVSEGFDVPAIEAAILLRPTQSVTLALQQVGRSLRPYPGKTEAVILDHAGNLMRHGLPDEPREWSLAGRERKRASSSERTMPTVVCAGCFAVFRPQPCCPYCGLRREVGGREVDEVEGELAEVDIAALREHREFVRRKMEERECKSREDWVRLGQRRGYKPGWGVFRWEAAQKRRVRA